MRANRIIMGTGVSIDIPDCRNQKVFSELFSMLEEMDQRFSTYKPTSEVSRFQRGEIKQEDLSTDFKFVIKQCTKWAGKTDGFFNAEFSGEFDPSGYVKGWAIQKAGDLINKSGFNTYCVAIGGDILASSDDDKTWNVGLQNPEGKGSIIGKLSAKNLAVATSGNYERGSHIINPKSGKPATKLKVVTVVGPDIVTADVLATTAFAMGSTGKDFLKKWTDYSSLIIDNDNSPVFTGEMKQLLKIA